MRRVLQSPETWEQVAVAGWVVGGFAAFFGVAAEVMPFLRLVPVYVTAWWAAAYWAAGAAVMLAVRPADWGPGGRWLPLARLLWALGAVTHLAHVAAAFGIVHGWSHAAAYRDTERASGVGEGVFVNYLFALVWAADALWLAAFPNRYAGRPRWVGRAAHGFLAFVTFNAAVVYGSDPARWAAAAAFGLLAVLLVRRLRVGRPTGPAQG